MFQSVQRFSVTAAAVVSLFPMFQYIAERDDRELERVALATLAMSACREAYEYRLEQSTAAQLPQLDAQDNLAKRRAYCTSIDTLADRVLSTQAGGVLSF